MRYIPDDNLSYPVRINLANGSSGSGFYLRVDNRLYFVTARHVLFEKKKDSEEFSLMSNKAKLISYPKDLKIKDPIVASLDIEDSRKKGLVKFGIDTDIAVVKIGDVEPVINTKNFSIKPLSSFKFENISISPIIWVHKDLFKRYEDVMISNEIIISGYPSSLGRGDQIDPLKPLLRKGIVAGKNDKKKTIIADCPVYYGNSGGLVVEIEHMENGLRKMHCIGVVSEFVPFDEKLLSLQHRTISISVENSGYSVVLPIDTILSLID
jgi:hypothetical protein